VPLPLVARSGGVALAGSLWVPAGDPLALLVMHPGSGPADRDNGDLFPRIRTPLLRAGIAVASFDKRGVGGSEGSWLEAGIERQAADLLAGLGSAAAHVPGVPCGTFGHSEGGWVVVDAADRAALGEIAFVITSAGPAVRAGVAERFASTRTLDRIARSDADRARAEAAVDAFFALAEAGATHAQMLALVDERGDELAHLLEGDVPDERLWSLFVQLAAFDPLPRMRSLRVPMLAIFGADDALTPTAASVEALRAAVDPALLQLAVLPGAGHRMAHAGEHDFAAGYLETIIAFVLTHSR
jgi:hypothetical protein